MSIEGLSTMYNVTAGGSLQMASASALAVRSNVNFVGAAVFTSSPAAFVDVYAGVFNYPYSAVIDATVRVHDADVAFGGEADANNNVGNNNGGSVDVIVSVASLNVTGDSTVIIEPASSSSSSLSSSSLSSFAALGIGSLVLTDEAIIALVARVTLCFASLFRFNLLCLYVLLFIGQFVGSY
jgi:hypothetical protein